MKLSKINHTRTAVGRKSELNGNNGGFLYKSPGNIKNAVQNIDDQAEKSAEMASRLYAMLSPNDIFNDNNSREKHELEKTLRSHLKINFVRGLQWILKGKRRNRKNNYVFSRGDVCRAWGNSETLKSVASKVNTDVGYVVRGICSRSLRKSWHRYVSIGGKSVPMHDIFADFVYAMMMYGNADALSEEKMTALCKRLSKDINLMGRVKEAVISIKKNNVRVQVDATKKPAVLVLSSVIGDRAKAKNKKGYVFDFIRDFAQANPMEQDKALVNIKRLILLLVCGKDYFVKATDGKLGPWSWGACLPQTGEPYSEEADALWRLREEIQAKRKYENVNTLEEKQEQSEIKRAIKKYEADIKGILDRTNVDRYRAAVSAVGGDKKEVYWLRYFQDGLEKMLALGIRKPRFLERKYICQKLYRDWVSYVTVKYIELGKAVYHFAMPEAHGMSGKMSFGEIQPRFLGGLTSFDYERIKAEENISRALAVSATYAGAILANDIVEPEVRTKAGKDMEDVLSYSREQIFQHHRDDAKRRILQFFGGKSRWQDTGIDDIVGGEFAYRVAKAVSLARNHSYHYTPKPGSLSDEVKETALLLLDGELARTGAVYAEKYYTNGVPCFYREKDIKILLDELYSKKVSVPAQIPSFANVLAKSKSVEFIRSLVGIKFETSLPNLTEVMKFRSSVYFVLKEIYYNGFLRENCYERFMTALNNDYYKIRERGSSPEASKIDQREWRVIEPFVKRVNEIADAYDGKNFSSLCQGIMTDVNIQNPGNMKVRAATAAQKKGDKKVEAYPQFRMLLWKYIRLAFQKYVEEKPEYAFLKKPIYDETFYKRVNRPSQFCPDFKPQRFAELRSLAEKNHLALSWFITAHFLTPKQLNFLRGDIKSYNQFISNINVRAASTGHDCDESARDKVAYYQELLDIMDLTALFSGKVSRELTDYFKDDADYYAYLRNFIDDGKIDECDGDNEGLFFDRKNPIINRGVVFSVMYGLENILGNIGYTVTVDDYQKYIEMRDSVELQDAYKKEGKPSCNQQELRNSFQQLKSRLKLYDLQDYADVVLDHLGQLVSFAYFHERDMMYYQLGVHYLRLFHSDNVPAEDEQRVIKSVDDNMEITNGALLYEIMAAYTPDLKVFYKKGGKVVSKLAGSGGAGVALFWKMYGIPRFIHGLQLFVGLTGKNGEQEYDYRVGLRKDIAHMKYLCDQKKSIMDYYSDVYNYFLRYDVRLKKSVSFIFQNIMLNHGIIAETSFEKQNGHWKLLLKDDKLKSDVFIFKGRNKDKPETRKVCKRTDRFVKEIARVLEKRASE